MNFLTMKRFQFINMISIIYLTNRINPKFEWFCDSLCNQTTDQERADLEVIFIDHALGKPFDHNEISRKEYLKIVVGDRFKYIHSIPKPNIYQGENRKTTGEYFSTANARNTGVILSSGDYLVFVDDVSVLMPSWWKSVKRAQERKMIVCGSYRKDFDMVVENGNLISSRVHAAGKDSRRGGDHVSKIAGGSLYGCSLGIPVEDILLVNGFDELCDSIGGEDYQFGIRLNYAGKSIFYDPKMLTIESEELHVQPYLMKREDRVLPEAEYMDMLRTFNVHKRSRIGNWDSSHMILDILYGKMHAKSFYNNYDLAECRREKKFPAVNENNNHWFDNKPLIEMS